MHRRTSDEAMDMFARRKAKLVLDDGTCFLGLSFGAEVCVSGEVVFNTAMVGYPEALTDPSYRGQILTCTYPLIGNYGVPPDDKDDTGLPVFFESSSIHITALLVSEYSSDSCHWNQVKSLGSWLKEHNVPGLSGIDTRALTKRIRERGAMLGKIVFDGTPVRSSRTRAHPLADGGSWRCYFRARLERLNVYGAAPLAGDRRAAHRSEREEPGGGGVACNAYVVHVAQTGPPQLSWQTHANSRY